MPQRLAAILAADIAGYTRLMELDESGVVEAWRRARSEAIDPTTARHGGRIVKLTGDGFLAEFPTAESAVLAALELQEQFGEMFAELPADRRIAFRIGVNAGDIWVDNEDIYGAGVNVAARLEALAESGGICVSDSVHDFVKHKVAARFEDLGFRSVKNVAQPVRVWRVAGSISTADVGRAPRRSRRALLAAVAAGVIGAAALAAYLVATLGPGAGAANDRSAARVQRAATEPVTVAVLPFANSSGDPDQSHFSDGLTDELINRLQRLPGLRVTGRTSAFAFRDSGQSLPEIAAALGVQHVIEGSVGREGDRLRIRVQLSDAEGFGLWAERYDRERASIFDVQDEIVRAIAEELRATLGLERALQAAPRTADVGAYELYVSAKAFTFGGSPEDYQRALGLLDLAVARDPAFLRAWALKVAVNAAQSDFLPPDDRERHVAAAEEAAAQAAALEPPEGDGYAASALATVHGWRGEWSAAGEQYRRALELGLPPSEVATYAIFLITVGRFEQASEVIEETLAADPLAAGPLGFLMLNHELRGDRAAADAIYARGVSLHPLGWYGDAVALWIWLGRAEPKPPVTELRPVTGRIASALRDMTDGRERGLELVRQWRVDPGYAFPVAQVDLAIWAAYFSDPLLAVEALETAVSESPLLMHLAWLPVFADVRQLPEFRAMLEALGLVDYWRAVGWPGICQPTVGDAFECR